MDKTVPPGRVKGTLTPPCSKSYAQRALAAALLTDLSPVIFVAAAAALGIVIQNVIRRAK